MIDNNLYKEDIIYTSGIKLPWEKLKNKSILITGASGLIGSYLVDVIMYKNINHNLNCTLYAIGRNVNNAKKIFASYWNLKNFQFISHDINFPLIFNKIEKIDYVVHMASNTHPVVYSTDPIGTITSNVIGTYNLLEFSIKHKATRFTFISSNEIYGENRKDVEFFNEEYCGYINCNTMRAGYPESKRCGEALCQAYKKQKNLNIVIPRLTRSYGPTILKTDTKAISQFISKGVAGEDIILKSSGTQYYSYTYVGDAVSGLITTILKGKDGEAYNIADESSDIMLKDLALIVANYSGKRIIFQIPDEVEKAGYSIATKARLDGSKIKNLGWKARYNIHDGIIRTMQILQSCCK